MGKELVIRVSKMFQFRYVTQMLPISLSASFSVKKLEVECAVIVS